MNDLLLADTPTTSSTAKPVRTRLGAEGKPSNGNPRQHEEKKLVLHKHPIDS